MEVDFSKYHISSNSKGNEVKSKMKHPSDMPTPRLELKWLVIQHATS